jgi:protein-tyrosine phosphatase
VLLGALGVDRATITEDYLLTNEVTAGDVEKIVGALNVRKGVPPEILRPVLDAAPEYLDTAFAQVEADYGALDGYLRSGLGLADDELAALRARLLE